MKDEITFTLKENPADELYELLKDIDVEKTPAFTISDTHGKIAEYVKVIRCEDCKYYTGYECQRTKVSNIRVITNEGDYCSMAERKPPQVNPEMVKALKDRIEKQRGEE